jgi:hypothetical protein
MKILIGSILFFILLVGGLPKKNIYYFIEHKLIDKNIQLVNEKIDDKLFSFSLSSMDILYNQINVAKVENILISPYLFSNTIEIKKIHINEILKNTMPSKIENIKIVYSLLNPLNVELSASGDFGIIEGTIGIFTRLLIAKIQISNSFKTRFSVLSQNKNIIKTKKGYVYEYQF